MRDLESKQDALLHKIEKRIERRNRRNPSQLAQSFIPQYQQSFEDIRLQKENEIWELEEKIKFDKRAEREWIERERI